MLRGDKSDIWSPQRQRTLISWQGAKGERSETRECPSQQTLRLTMDDRGLISEIVSLPTHSHSRIKHPSSGLRLETKVPRKCSFRRLVQAARGAILWIRLQPKQFSVSRPLGHPFRSMRESSPETSMCFRLGKRSLKRPSGPLMARRG